MFERLIRLSILLLLALGMGLVNTHAQTISQIDSLNRLAENNSEGSPDYISKIAKQALQFSKDIGYINGEIQALNNLCFACYIRGENEDAIKACKKAIELNNANGDRFDVSNSYNYLGLTYIQIKEFDAGINEMLKLIDIATKNDNNYLLADACSNIGLAYLLKGAPDKAKEYYHIAAKIHEEIDHPTSKVYVDLNLGQLYYNKEQYDSALYFLKKSNEAAKKLDNSRAMYYSFVLMGQLPIINQDSATYYLLEAIQITGQLDWDIEMLNSHIYLSHQYRKTGKYNMSIQAAEMAESLAEKLKKHEKLLECYDLMVRNYTQTEEISKAQLYLDKRKKLSDSLHLNQKNELITGLLDANQKLGAEREYDQLKLELEAAELRIQEKNYIILISIIGITFVLLILAFIMKLSRLRAKSNIELRQLNDQLDASNKEKDLLMGMIAHDLRSPMNKILGLTQLLKNKKPQDEEAYLIGLIESMTIESKTLTDELLEINRIESGKFKTKKSKIDIKAFFDEIVYHQDQAAKSKLIEVSTDWNFDKETIESDRGILQRVIENILSNAIKFCNPKSRIHVSADLKQNKLHVSVRDTGPGIPESERNQLFKRFGKTSVKPTANEPSTGLGLYIVQSLVERLRGNIYLNTEYKEGAEFVIDIPV
ncbi:tetratricopeptide repeat-containing sensor histidine kinase [Reichenbachiella ulvae]|uniref:histidine kinase n=1 Tax=Reichenbachiella ulvae TaxID=2980104 RepID=A0ABT3CUW5_9BACT|nr:ATP-binding protein [Reichenbachiella ulvae]MCV9387028.1 ATP-binding protein [Reichenbachiella ulvae]